jgi:cell division septation protein DedD
MTRMGLWQNVDPLREAEERPRGSRFGTLILTSLGGAFIVFAVISQSRRNAPPARRSNDALGDLLAQAKAAPPAAPAELFRDEVTFPSLLSDEAKTTTALVAVRPAGQAPAGDETNAKQSASPPPPTDRLPVIPLPARNLVSSSSFIERQRDALSRLTRQASATAAPLAAAGRPGGYQLQASSFRSESEAASFAMALRQRGHHAYTEVAQAPGRGTLHRVRIGPFPTKRDAMTYRAAFEEREHLVPFVLDPQ